MITKKIQITEVTIDELTEKVADKLMQKLEKLLKSASKKENVEL